MGRSMSAANDEEWSLPDRLSSLPLLTAAGNDA